MKRCTGLVLTIILISTALACGGPRKPVETVRIPPRVDLKPLETIGVVEFDSTADGELAAMATRRFTDWARRDQGLIRMMDFGTRDDTLDMVNRERWDPETIRVLGREQGVQTVLEGELTVSKVRPDISISSSLRSGRVSARVEATLSVQMVETATGASIWSSAATSSGTVGQVSVFGGKAFSFDADDPDAAYGDLVNSLVEQVTRDFRSTWQRR